MCTQTILLHICNDNVLQSDVVNALLLYGKYYIFYCRCANIELNILHFRQYVSTFYSPMIEMNRESKFLDYENQIINIVYYNEPLLL